MIKILLLMILCHIIDDFVLQPICLSKLKQKEWWEENAHDFKYEFDYLAALFIHALSWSIMIILPILFSDIELMWYQYLIVLVNTFVHAAIDDMKANDKQINLLQDQLMHFVQIIVTFIILVV